MRDDVVDRAVDALDVGESGGRLGGLFPVRKICQAAETQRYAFVVRTGGSGRSSAVAGEGAYVKAWIVASVASSAGIGGAGALESGGAGDARTDAARGRREGGGERK